MLEVRGQVETPPGLSAGAGAREAVAQRRRAAHRSTAAHGSAARGDRGVVRGSIQRGAGARHGHASIHVLASEAVPVSLAVTVVVVVVQTVGGILLAGDRNRGCEIVLLRCVNKQ